MLNKSENLTMQKGQQNESKLTFSCSSWEFFIGIGKNVLKKKAKNGQRLFEQRHAIAGNYDDYNLNV